MARTRATGDMRDRGETSLDAAMRAPSMTAPDVVVLDFIEEEPKVKDLADPKKDLWLSTCDGRYSSPIIPVRVGPHAKIFPVHRDILTKSEYFRKALDGNFREADDQAIDLPEEDPDIFSFVVAYLYEAKYVPIKAMSTALVAEPDKGKGREDNEGGNSTVEDLSDSDGSATDESARNRRRRRRREQRAWQHDRRKQVGRHRPNCNCQTCTADLIVAPCWSCGASGRPPPPRNRYYGAVPPLPAGPVPIAHPGLIYPRGNPARPRDRNRGRPARNDAAVVVEEPVLDERMCQEDLRTWALTYTLSIDVYVCAERYLMRDFKACIAAFLINTFEVAGLDAGLPAVLYSCKTLHNGVSRKDPLLKKIFARVGFLQVQFEKNFKKDTQKFFAENPELAPLILREMVERFGEDQVDDLPPMERVVPLVPFGVEEGMIQGRRPQRDAAW